METVTASNGTPLPVDSLAQTLTYDGDLVATVTVHYAGITYVQTMTNNGTSITGVSQWVAQP
jgi:hypothetical protein